jgi:hypothetical protein
MQLSTNQNHPSMNRVTSHQLTLRAVGQVLDLLHVHSFEIEIDGKHVIIHGVTEKAESEVVIKAMGFGKLVKIFRRNGATGPKRRRREKAPRPFTFSGMRFSEEDLDRLELRGQASRRNSDGTPAYPSLSQVLRALGAYIDHKRAQLTRISGRDNQIAIFYKMPFGVEKVETFTQTNLYDLWVHMYKLRRHDDPFEKNPILRSA